jgi:hypothetical protein
VVVKLNVNKMKNIGIVLLAIGLIITLYTGFTYITREKVVDIGKLEISANKRHRVSWSPFIGIAVMAIGGGVLLYGWKLKR